MKAVATGLTCVALVAVLATWSLGDGQDAPKPEVEVKVVVDGQPVEIDGAKTDVEIKDVTQFDVALLDDGELELVNADGVERELIILSDEEGSQPQVIKIQAGGGADGKPGKVVTSTRSISIMHNGVPGEDAKKALDKVADELNAQADALEKDGKQAEAEAKRSASKAIRGLLEGHGPLGKFQFHVPGGKPAGEIDVLMVGPTEIPGHIRKTIKARVVGGPENKEVQELKRKLEALSEERREIESKLTGELLSKARQKLKQATEDVERKLVDVQTHAQVWSFIEGEGGPVTARIPGIRINVPGFHGMEIAGFEAVGGPVRELHAKSAALVRASQAMKEAGKHDEAQRLMAESEELKMKAAKVAQAHAAQLHGGLPGAAFSFVPGQPGAELHHSLKELQEQIQLLRKEVAEVKEMLKK